MDGCHLKANTSLLKSLHAALLTERCHTSEPTPSALLIEQCEAKRGVGRPITSA